MKAYIVMHVDITHPSQYEQYKSLSTIAGQAHNVTILVRGGNEKILEGETMHRTVIMEFPSKEAAEQYYDSPEYRKARQARAGAANVNMCIVEGL